MLKYRDASIGFMVIMLGMMGYDYLHGISYWYYIALVFMFSLVIFLGSYFIQSGFFLKAFCEGDKNKNQIAITFDDGPHANTPVILDVLKKNGSTAAFFCIGKRIAGNEEIIKRISSEGHIVSNHSFSHNNLIDFFPLKKLKDDVSKTDQLIFDITGKKNYLFRPPFGVTTPAISQMAADMKYKVMGWNLRSYDTTIKDKDKLLQRILTRIKNGSVILLHDTTPGIADLLQKILDHAKEKNMNIVSLEEMFQIKAHEPV